MANETKRDEINKFIKLFEESFNLDEFKLICFDLGVLYDSLPNVPLSLKIRELVALLSRRNKLDELEKIVKKTRPEKPWPDIKDAQLSFYKSPFLVIKNPYIFGVILVFIVLLIVALLFPREINININGPSVQGENRTPQSVSKYRFFVEESDSSIEIIFDNFSNQDICWQVINKSGNIIVPSTRVSETPFTLSNLPTGSYKLIVGGCNQTGNYEVSIIGNSPTPTPILAATSIFKTITVTPTPSITLTPSINEATPGSLKPIISPSSTSLTPTQTSTLPIAISPSPTLISASTTTPSPIPTPTVTPSPTPTQTPTPTVTPSPTPTQTPTPTVTPSPTPTQTPTTTPSPTPTPTSEPVTKFFELPVGESYFGLEIEPINMLNAASFCQEINQTSNTLSLIGRMNNGTFEDYFNCLDRSGNNFELVLGEGYYLLSENSISTTVSLDGLEILPPFTLEISGGGQQELISFPIAVNLNASGFCQKVMGTGIQIQKIWQWQASSWEEFECSENTGDFVLKSGVGYLILSHSSGNVSLP